MSLKQELKNYLQVRYNNLKKITNMDNIIHPDDAKTNDARIQEINNIAAKFQITLKS